MPIVHFAKYSKEARGIADQLRNGKISSGEGALIVDEKQSGEPRYLLEKIIAGASLNQPMPANKIPWKEDSLVILVGAKAVKVLDEFEELAPGFNKMFGPVQLSDSYVR